VKIVADIKLRLEKPAIQRRDIAICAHERAAAAVRNGAAARELPYVLIGGQSFTIGAEVKDIFGRTCACWTIAPTSRRSCGLSYAAARIGQATVQKRCWSRPCNRGSRCGYFDCAGHGMRAVAGSE